MLGASPAAAEPAGGGQFQATPAALSRNGRRVVRVSRVAENRNIRELGTEALLLCVRRSRVTNGMTYAITFGE